MSCRHSVRSLVFACGILFALSSVRCALAAQPVLLVPPGPLILATVGISRGADLRIEVWKTQEEAVTRLATGDAAAAVLPVTVGAALSAKADIVLLGAFRENVFSLVVRDDAGWENLRGREILVAQGRGTVLDSILRSVLSSYGLKPGRDVTLIYAPAPEAVALYHRGKTAIVALPEPFASLALENGGRSLDPQEAWGRLAGASARFPVGGVFAMRSVLRDNPGHASLVTSAIAASTAWFTEHPEQACDLAGEAFGMPSERFRKALPRIHISFDSSEACSSDVMSLLSRLYETLSPDMAPPPAASFYPSGSGGTSANP